MKHRLSRHRAPAHRVLPAVALAVLAGASSAQDAAVGSEIYMRYCATCHGEKVEGDGPMAGAMVVKPADLTRLSARNQGVFPTTRVVMRIDGRDPLTSHGSPMPVYGDFFEGNDTALKAETGQPIMTSRMIVDLVAFLEGVQQE